MYYSKTAEVPRLSSPIMYDVMILRTSLVLSYNCLSNENGFKIFVRWHSHRFEISTVLTKSFVQFFALSPSNTDIDPFHSYLSASDQRPLLVRICQRHLPAPKIDQSSITEQKHPPCGETYLEVLHE